VPEFEICGLPAVGELLGEALADHVGVACGDGELTGYQVINHSLRWIDFKAGAPALSRGSRPASRFECCVEMPQAAR
jgi:hypothetical protein